MKVIIDTNIVIDALYDRINNCLMVLDLADKNKITPVVSQELEREYNLIAGKVILNSMRDSFKAGTLKAESFDAAQDVLHDLHKNINKIVLDIAERCIVTSSKNISPDYGDNKVINLAIDSNCRVIITKNVADFRCVEQKGISNAEGKPILIMTPKQFTKYYKEHVREIELEQQHIKTISKYRDEFKPAKYFTPEDTKALNELNAKFKKFMPVKEILKSYKLTKTKIAAISTQLDKIENMDKQLKELAKTMDEYELHKKTVDKYESSILPKLTQKEGYKEAKLKLDKCETYLKFNGICTREDINKQLDGLNIMLTEKPQLAHKIEELNKYLSVFAKAIEAINRVLMRDRSLTPEHDRMITIDR